MIKVDGLKKSYGDFNLECTMEVRRGRITGLVGRNGAGKSTVFKSILGLVRPDAGEIELFSGECANEKEIKERTGTVFAEGGFSDCLTVRKIASVLESAYSGFSKEYFLERCRKAGLPEKKKLKEFSTGMKAMLKCITATSYGAELLILDEPTAGLDVIARNRLLDMLRYYMTDENRAMVISSHIAGDLENLCDDIYFIDRGRIIFHEETDRIISDYGVIKVRKDEFEKLDKEHILKIRETDYGYMLLTAEKRYYMENYRDIEIENGGIDTVLSMLAGGETDEMSY